jgi:cell division septation protein DedD
MADEASREIQLNGKQLVFLFMAATVAAVVIFLCGVMVGRGVQTTRNGLGDLSVEAASDPTANVQSPAAATDQPVAGDGSTPSASDEDLSYPERLAEPSPPPETLSESPAPTSVERKSSAPAPSGEGFTVQVAAVKEQSEAETIAKRLTRKGYAAYVMSPAARAPQVFRVRVGKYRDRREAETVANRLEREEQFKPWITR